MPSFVSPGVFPIEKDFSLYVPNLSTTIGGMVGTAQKGPLNSATLVTSALEFIQTFGEPDPSMFGPYAALQFLQEGSQLYYVRVAGPLAAEALYLLPSNDDADGAPALASSISGPFAVIPSTSDALVITELSYVSGLEVPTVRNITLGGRGVATTSVNAGGLGYRVADAGTITGGDSLGTYAVATITKSSFSITAVSTGGSSTGTFTIAGDHHLDFLAGELLTVSGSTNNNAVFTVVSAVYGIATVITVVETVGAVADGAMTGQVGVALTTTVGASGASYTVATGDATSATTGTGTGLTLNVLTLAARTAAQVVADAVATGGYSGWGVTVTNVGGLVTVTRKVASQQLGFQISGTANTLLQLTAAEVFGVEDMLLPATIIGSATAPFNIGSSDDTLTIKEIDYRTGVAVVTNRVFTLTHSATQTITQVVADINAAAESGDFFIYAADSGGALVISSPGLETDLFGLQVVASLAANELGLDTSYVHKGAKAKWLIQAASPGAWGNAISVTLAAGSLSGYKLTVKVAAVVVETFDNLSATPSDAAYVETMVNGSSAYITVTDNLLIGGPPATVADEPLTLGNDDLAGVSDASYEGIDSPPTGMQVFANPETININLLMIPGVSSAAVINAGIDLVTLRADAFYIVDSPFGLSAANVIKWHNGAAPYDDHQAFDSSYAAVYWPWLQVFDPVNNVKVWTPPSGNVARSYAFTDRTSETWFAPAGINRGRLVTPLQVEHSATKGERDALYGDGNAINPIIMVPQIGITIWGERTLQRAPTALDRVNVRRMMLFLEKSIARTCRSLVFEPNDPILWSQFVDLATPFCLMVQSRRGIVDFKIICDKTTNTPSAIDRNEMHGTILIKPTKTAEFIVITFALTAQGATFSEILGF